MVCEGLVPASTFSSVDRNAARKPNRFILSTVMRNRRKKLATNIFGIKKKRNEKKYFHNSTFI
jgi:hypothetical protein